LPNPIDVVEALLFASDVPLEPERIREVLDLENGAAARTPTVLKRPGSRERDWFEVSVRLTRTLFEPDSDFVSSPPQCLFSCHKTEAAVLFLPGDSL